MTLQQLISDLTERQVVDILYGDGIESKGSISDIKNEGKGLYSYEQFNSETQSFSRKLVKIVLHPEFYFFTIEYMQIVRH